MTGTTSRCADHLRATDAARGTRSARGYDNRWLAARARFLREQPTCRPCEAEGRVTEATTVDHVRPHRGNEQLFWDETNWQPICASCHSKKTASETGARIVAQLVRLERTPCVPVVVICSPSAVLAREVAQRHLRADDLVLDVDYLVSLASGMPMYECQQPEVLRRALHSRNNTLRAIGGIRVPWRKMWFLTSAPYVGDRRHWRTTLCARVLVLEVPPDVVATRIQADGYGAKERRCADAYAWWSHYAADPQDQVARTMAEAFDLAGK